jgi:hypothetical protein
LVETPARRATSKIVIERTERFLADRRRAWPGRLRAV